MAHKISILNFKGGVGKTTTTINLAASLSSKGRTVLVVDTDFQCNTTETLGFSPSDGSTLYDALTVKGFQTLPVYKFRDGFFFIPSSPAMEFVSDILNTRLSRETYLRRILSVAESSFDFIIIDCPSNGGLLNTNAMAASDSLIIPMLCEPYSMKGIGKLRAPIAEMQAELNPSLRVLGYLRTMFDARLRDHKQASLLMEQTYGDMMIPVVIRVNAALKKVSRSCPTVFDLDSASGIRPRGAADYDALADWVISRTTDTGITQKVI